MSAPVGRGETLRVVFSRDQRERVEVLRERGPRLMAFDVQKTLDLLVCPKSHARLVYEEGWLVSTDPDTRLRYAIKDDIPVMLIDEAEAVPVDDWKTIMQRHGRSPETGQIESGGD